MRERFTEREGEIGGGDTQRMREREGVPFAAEVPCMMDVHPRLMYSVRRMYSPRSVYQARLMYVRQVRQESVS